MIMIVRDSMKKARPTSEDKKYGGDGMMSYHIFKNNFKSAAREDILAASDIINEAANWTKGRPKNIVRTYLGNKNPEAALKAMWIDLDVFYGLKTTSIEERVKTFSKGPKFDRDDLEAHIDLITELKALKLEAEGDSIKGQLDRPDMVRDIIGSTIPYLKDSFFEKETKLGLKKSGFKFKFDDLVQAVF